MLTFIWAQEPNYLKPLKHLRVFIFLLVFFCSISEIIFYCHYYFSGYVKCIFLGQEYYSAKGLHSHGYFISRLLTSINKKIN